MQLPAAFTSLRREQQVGALTALERVEPDLQQTVLDEWAVRCSSQTVRNPAGYLFGIITKALRGDFRAWAAAQRTGVSTSTASAAPAERNGVIAPDRALAERHLAELRRMLQID